MLSNLLCASDVLGSNAVPTQTMPLSFHKQGFTSIDVRMPTGLTGVPRVQCNLFLQWQHQHPRAPGAVVSGGRWLQQPTAAG